MLLIVAVDDADKSLEITKTAQKHFPELKLMVRTQSWTHSFEMMDLGIEDFYREYTDSALRLGTDALKNIGLRQYQIQRSLKQFRKYDNEMIRGLYSLRHEQKTMLRTGKEFMENIERLMKDDIDRIGSDSNAGWNTNSIKEDMISMHHSNKVADDLE